MPNYAALPIVQEPRRTLEQVFKAWLYGEPMDREEKRRIIDTAHDILGDRYVLEQPER